MEATANKPPETGGKQRLIRHLQSIDSALTSFVDRLAGPRIKDLSSPERFVDGIDKLEPADLVAIQLTDHFPENGIIRPKAHYQPETLRFTNHFTVNALAPEINLMGWKWDQKRYAILVPFDKLKDRVLAFNPADTFVLEDIELPEGTVILKDRTDTTAPQSAGRAQIVEADFSKPGERITGFQRAVYEQMIQMGYFLQGVGERGDYYGWDMVLPSGRTIRGRDILEHFCEENGLEFAKGNPHASHWTGQLEDIAFDIKADREDNDQEALEVDVRRAEEFLRTTQIPEKYKQALTELILGTQQSIVTEEPLRR